MKKLFFLAIAMISLTSQAQEGYDFLSGDVSDLSADSTIFWFNSRKTGECHNNSITVVLAVSNTTAVDGEFTVGGGDGELYKEYGINHFETLNLSSFPFTIDTTLMRVQYGTDTVYTKSWEIVNFPFPHIGVQIKKGANAGLDFGISTIVSDNN